MKGKKGNSAGIIYAPYIPVMFTDTDPHVTVTVIPDEHKVIFRVENKEYTLSSDENNTFDLNFLNSIYIATRRNQYKSFEKAREIWKELVDNGFNKI